MICARNRQFKDYDCCQDNRKLSCPGTQGGPEEFAFSGKGCFPAILNETIPLTPEEIMGIYTSYFKLNTTCQ
jgi:hypothetical protein